MSIIVVGGERHVALGVDRLPRIQVGILNGHLVNPLHVRQLVVSPLAAALGEHKRSSGTTSLSR